MSLEQLKETKPFLKEVIELYDKVLQFDEVELLHEYSRFDNQYVRYMGEDVDHVLDEFSRIFSLSSEILVPVKDAMNSGIIDFFLLAQGEAASFSLPFMSDEMFSLLYILSRPFFHSIQKRHNIDNIYWEEGKCPVCNALPSLSMIEESAKRNYSCSFCGTTGSYKRIGCPHCQNEDAKMIDIFYAEENHKGVRVDTCKKCNTYVKTFDAKLLSQFNREEIDLLSLPLDVIAQKKKFARKSPNPVGILRFV